MLNYEFRLYHKNKKPTYIVLLGNTRQEADAKLAHWYPKHVAEKNFTYVGLIHLSHDTAPRPKRRSSKRY